MTFYVTDLLELVFSHEPEIKSLHIAVMYFYTHVKLRKAVTELVH